MTETKQPKQLPVSEKEASLLKVTFKENEYLLKALRALFFGFDVSTEDKDLIKKTFSNIELKEALRKKMYPMMSADVPIGEVADFWIGVEQQIFGASRDAIFQAVNSKMKVLELLEQAIKLLDNPDGDKIDLSFNPKYSADELQIGLLARNLYIKTIEMALYMIKQIADLKEETPEEKKKRMALDSSK